MDRCFVMLPWGRYEVRLASRRWSTFSFRVPTGYRGSGAVSVELLSPDCFFPIDVIGGEDRRCLGVVLGPPADVRPWEDDAMSWVELERDGALRPEDVALIATLRPLTDGKMPRSVGRFF